MVLDQFIVSKNDRFYSDFNETPTVQNSFKRHVHPTPYTFLTMTTECPVTDLTNIYKSGDLFFTQRRWGEVKD